MNKCSVDIKPIFVYIRSSTANPTITSHGFSNFSQYEEEFVEGEMAEFLEELGFKICCHRRDFDLGVPIGQNIEDATMYSRRMICIISR